MPILVTGFEAFNGESVNPAQISVSRLPDAIEGEKVIRLILPVTYEGSRRLVKEALERFRPEVVLCVGQAAGRKGVTPEANGQNRVSTEKADSTGEKPLLPVLIAGGEEKLPVTLDAAKMCEALKRAGIPCALSENAGDYVCNALIYRLLFYIRKNDLPVRTGFVHVPLNEAQARARGKGEAGLPQSQIDLAVRLCAAASLSI